MLCKNCHNVQNIDFPIRNLIIQKLYSPIESEALIVMFWTSNECPILEINFILPEPIRLRGCDKTRSERLVCVCGHRIDLIYNELKAQNQNTF